MVDNEQLEARMADGIAKETSSLACFGPAISQGQNAPLSVTDTDAGDGQGDADIDTEDDKSTCATSADLRPIVIDGSNIAMRFDFYSLLFYSVRRKLTRKMKTPTSNAAVRPVAERLRR